MMIVELIRELEQLESDLEYKAEESAELDLGTLSACCRAEAVGVRRAINAILKRHLTELESQVH